MSNYMYIGKDGKPILARTLEDQRDALYEALKSLTENVDEGDFVSTTRIDAAYKALAKARGES